MIKIHNDEEVNSKYLLPLVEHKAIDLAWEFLHNHNLYTTARFYNLKEKFVDAFWELYKNALNKRTES